MQPLTDDILCDATRRHVPGWGGAEVRLELIEKGGSDRRYYRARAVGGGGLETAILMVYSDQRADNAGFFGATEILGFSGARTMEIYAHDVGRRLAWMEDLGREDLWERRQGEGALGLYRDSLGQVARLHGLAAGALPERLRGHLQPPFDVRLYRWEQDYFFEQFGRRFLGLAAGELEELREGAGLTELAESLAARPRCLVHRDFQSQNVMVRRGEAWMIDYQGIREGCAEYDVASLLYDPYVGLSAGEREGLWEDYRELRRAGDGGEVSGEVLAMAASQRLMQALGAYGKLGVGDGKVAFLRHIPAAVRHLEEVLAGSGLLPELRVALGRRAERWGGREG